MKIIKSVKPSGTYVKVRLLQPWCAGRGQREWAIGEMLVCNDKLADYLSSKMIGAVMIEGPDRPTRILVPSVIH